MTNNLLQFIRPTKTIGPDDIENMVHPSSSGFMVYKKIKDSESLYRNIIAWYLKAAGVKTTEIAKHLSISESRVKSLANRTKKQLYRGYNSIEHCAQEMKLDKKQGSFDETKANRHLLSAALSEMQSAEYGLSMSIKADLLFVSKSLTIGRDAYMAQFNEIFGTKCNCRYCQIGLHEINPFWLEK